MLQKKVAKAKSVEEKREAERNLREHMQERRIIDDTVRLSPLYHYELLRCVYTRREFIVI